MQNTFNNQAINKLPRIKDLIRTANSFESQQMTYKTLNACLNASVSITEMTKKQLEHFQDDLINTFKYKEWIK